MSRILSPNQSALENHFVETLHLFDAKIETVEQSSQTGINAAQATANTAVTNAATAQTAADTAVTNAATAQTAADTAQTSADTAQTAADTAQSTATNGVNRLAGDDNWFEGTALVTGTPNGSAITNITTVSATGISYNPTGYFNFSYLGKYLVTATQTGTCHNTRTDWYEEVVCYVNNAVRNVGQGLTFKSVPPLGDWNVENSGGGMIDVQQGDQWKLHVFMTQGTSNLISPGMTIRIKIKKVV